MCKPSLFFDKSSKGGGLAMRMRRGSLLSGTTFGAAILQYKIGDVVKPVIVNDNYFTGVVRDVDTKTNKVTVAWGGGPVSQHDVDEIMPGPAGVNYGSVEPKMASVGRRMKSGLGDDVPTHKDDCNCSLCDVMSTSGDEPPAQQPAWVIQDGPQESAIISSDFRRGKMSADPSMDNFLGEPGTHGIDKPRGGGFSIMEDLAKDLHQESNDLAGVHPKTGSDKKATGPDVDKIMRYENGEMDEDETVEFFQELIDTGAIFHLQGSYGRMAQRLISQGLCHRRGQAASSKQATIIRCPKCREMLDEDDAEWLGEDTRQIGWSKMRETCPKCLFEKTYNMSERGEVRNIHVINPGHLPMAASDGLKSRRAMYWCAPDRTFRLTQQEQQNGQANCPKCQVPMEKEPFTRSDKLLICPQCRFKVPTSKAVTKVDIQVPAGVEVDVTTKVEGDSAGCEAVGEVMMAGARRGKLAAVDPATLTNLPRMSISDIAGLVSDDWKNVNYGAKPYLDAMYSLHNVSDMYGMDTGTSVVAYFLSNASSWRGDVAKAVKKELQRRIR